MGKHRKGEFRTCSVCDCGEHGFVGLTQGLVALFSPEDMRLVEGATWGALRSASGAYARGYVGGGFVLMHRLFCQPRSGFVVDHINHDTLDNRRENIRSCTQSQNMMNAKPRKKTSEFKGVHRWGGMWIAQICVEGKRQTLGRFDVEEDAARAYELAAQKVQGAFAFQASVGG